MGQASSQVVESRSRYQEGAVAWVSALTLVNSIDCYSSYRWWRAGRGAKRVRRVQRCG